MSRKAAYYLTRAMRKYAGTNPKKVQRVAKQYGYDGGCIVPGCDLPARIHHIVPRRCGGSNAMENLMPICFHHESRIHAACAEYARIQKSERRTAEYRAKANARVNRVLAFKEEAARPEKMSGYLNAAPRKGLQR